MWNKSTLGLGYFTPSERCEITGNSHRGRCEIAVISHHPTGAVGNVCYFTPPPDKLVSKFLPRHFIKHYITFHFSNFAFLNTPQTKNNMKIFFSPFHEVLDKFSFFKFRVPGHTPGTRSWNTSRNALLGDIQECTPGQAIGAFYGTLLTCWVLRLWIQ